MYFFFALTHPSGGVCGVKARLAQCLNSVFQAGEGPILVGAFSVITNLRVDLRLQL